MVESALVQIEFSVMYRGYRTKFNKDINSFFFQNIKIFLLHLQAMLVMTLDRTALNIWLGRGACQISAVTPQPAAIAGNPLKDLPTSLKIRNRYN